MLSRILFVLLLCLLMVSDAFAEGLKHLAVLEFRGVGLNAQIVLNLSDQTRRAATELLSKDEYLILTRETMMEILSDMGKDATCLDGMCELEVGRNIQADIIVTGDIVQYGDTYVLTLKLYSTVSGALLHTVEVQEKDLLALKNKTFSESKVLFQKGLGLSGGSSGTVNIQSGFTGSVQNDDWDVSSGNTAIVAFSSSPSGAVVLVDGQLLCTETPCSKEIKAGSHKVVFQKERYFPYQSTINAKTGAKISGDLEARFGHVSVSSSPSGVKVLMDGERFGSTPISRTEVDAGVHTLSIEDPCYVGQDYRFQMKPGGEDDVTYPVTERQSAIKVTVMDKENVLLGDVYVDGNKVGQSSSVIKVPLCSKEVKVTVNDRTFTEKLTLQERQISEISVDASGLGPVVTGVDYTAKLIPARIDVLSGRFDESEVSNFALEAFSALQSLCQEYRLVQTTSNPKACQNPSQALMTEFARLEKRKADLLGSGEPDKLEYYEKWIPPRWNNLSNAETQACTSLLTFLDELEKQGIDRVAVINELTNVQTCFVMQGNIAD